MPISKKDALAAAETRDADAYKRFCDQVDSTVSRQAGITNPINVAIGNTPAHIVKRAVQEYEAVGWICNVVYDQRDGDFMTLA